NLLSIVQGLANSYATTQILIGFIPSQKFRGLASLDPGPFFRQADKTLASFIYLADDKVLRNVLKAGRNSSPAESSLPIAEAIAGATPGTVSRWKHHLKSVPLVERLVFECQLDESGKRFRTFQNGLQRHMNWEQKTDPWVESAKLLVEETWRE